MANRNAEVAEGLEQHMAQFTKGQLGRLELDLDRAPTEADMLWLTARTESRQLHLKRWGFEAPTLSITFQAGEPLGSQGVGFLPLLAIVPLVLGSLGIAVLAWRLYSDASGITSWIIPAALIGVGGLVAFQALGAFLRR